MGGRYYEEAVKADGERAAGWFYLGQSYRLMGNNEKVRSRDGRVRSVPANATCREPLEMSR